MKKNILVFALVAMLTGCSGNEVIESSPKKVNTIQLEQSEVQDYAEYTGYLLANEVKNYSFTQGGQLLTVNVKKGDVIKKDDVLAVLDSTLMNLGKDNAVANQNLAANESLQANINIESLEKNLAAEEIVLTQAEDALEAENLKLETLLSTYEKNISQLEDNFSLLKENYEKNKTLYENGIISKNDFDSLETQYKNSEDELNALYADKETNVNLQNIAINNAQKSIDAQKIKMELIENQIQSAEVLQNSADQQLSQAEIGVQQYEKQMDDTVLKATMDGSVVEVVMKEGEVTGAGTPVVVVKSNIKVVNVGVSLEDYENISLGDEVVTTFNEEEYQGIVTNIASYPDEATKTYAIEVELEENTIPLGSLVNVKFVKDKVDGMYIPINSIVNKNGVNYVYTVTEENLVTKQEVIMNEVSMDKVNVDGLEVGTKLIIDNLSTIQENDTVIVE